MEEIVDLPVTGKPKGTYMKWDPAYWLIFSIKARKNEANEAIHKAFIEFCNIETGGDYTQGLKRLLESYQVDWKYETLSAEILDLKKDLTELKQSPKNEEEEAF